VPPLISLRRRSRTVYDTLVVVLQFFQRYGKAKLIVSSDRPECAETIRPIYEAEEIEAVLRHALEDEAIFVISVPYASSRYAPNRAFSLPRSSASVRALDGCCRSGEP
jgi:hypothetical protein